MIFTICITPIIIIAGDLIRSRMIRGPISNKAVIIALAAFLLVCCGRKDALTTRNGDGELSEHARVKTDSQRNRRVILVSLGEASGTGAIHENLASQVIASLQRAGEKGADTLIFKLDTPGGKLSSSRRLANAILDVGSDDEGLRTVGFVTGEASGGGALVALACRTIYMSPGSNLGPAEPDVSRLKAPSKLLVQKIVSPVRSTFANVAESAGHPPVIAAGMVDRSLKIIGVEKKGTPQFHRAKNLRRLQRKAPGKRRASGEVTVVSPEGELVELNSEKAEDVGISSGAVESQGALLRKLGLKCADVVALVGREEEKP